MKETISYRMNQPPNPNSPKIRIIRLVVGMVVITLGIIIFNVSSKLYKEAEEKDAAEKLKREQYIESVIGETPDSLKHENK